MERQLSSPTDSTRNTAYRARNLAILAGVVIAAVAIGLAYVSIHPQTASPTIASSTSASQTPTPLTGSARTTSSSSVGSPILKVGDYAQYTGKRTTAMPINETVRLQVVSVNATSVEWTQSTTIGVDNSRAVYWAKLGSSPFHYTRANAAFTFVSSSNTSRLIGQTTYNVTAAVYSSPPDTNHTYYYVRGTDFLPIEVTDVSVSQVSSVAIAQTTYDDLYLTSTDISGVVVADLQG